MLEDPAANSSLSESSFKLEQVSSAISDLGSSMSDQQQARSLEAVASDGENHRRDIEERNTEIRGGIVGFGKKGTPKIVYKPSEIMAKSQSQGSLVFQETGTNPIVAEDPALQSSLL